MEKALLTNFAIQAGTTAVVSKYLVGLNWKKAALIGVASVVTPLIVARIRQQLTQPHTVTAATGVIQ